MRSWRISSDGWTELEVPIPQPRSETRDPDSRSETEGAYGQTGGGIGLCVSSPLNSFGR
jgi:hypothetical protein